MKAWNARKQSQQHNSQAEGRTCTALISGFLLRNSAQKEQQPFRYLTTQEWKDNVTYWSVYTVPASNKKPTVEANGQIDV